MQVSKSQRCMQPLSLNHIENLVKIVSLSHKIQHQRHRDEMPQGVNPGPSA